MGIRNLTPKNLFFRNTRPKPGFSVTFLWAWVLSLWVAISKLPSMSWPASHLLQGQKRFILLNPYILDPSEHSVNNPVNKVSAELLPLSEHRIYAIVWDKLFVLSNSGLSARLSCSSFSGRSNMFVLVFSLFPDVKKGRDRTQKKKRRFPLMCRPLFLPQHSKTTTLPPLIIRRQK